MLSAVWISCALVIVALAICSATVVATPKSTSAGVALNTLHPPYAPVVIKRRLKRTTAIEDTETFEERTPTFLNSEMEPFLDKLKSISAGIGKQLTRDVTSFPQTFSDNEFQLLNLDKLAKNEKLFNPNDLTEEFSLFKDPRFQKWVTYVQGRYSKTSPTVPYEEVMLKTLEQNYLGNGCALTRQFAAGTMLPQSESLAFKLLDMQLSTWLRSDVSVSMKELFTALELNGLNAKLFENPRFLLWLQFFKSRYEKAIKNGNEAAFELAKAADDLAKSTIEVAEKHHLSLKLLPEYPFNMIDGEAEKAKKAFEMATFLFLYKRLNFYVMDIATIEGSKVDNAKVKYIAVKLQHMLIGLSKWEKNQESNFIKLTNEVSKPMSRS